MRAGVVSAHASSRGLRDALQGKILVRVRPRARDPTDAALRCVMFFSDSCLQQSRRPVGAERGSHF
eukprot:4504226-Pyramimonas_sp.AAC.1